MRMLPRGFLQNFYYDNGLLEFVMERIDFSENSSDFF